MRYVKGFAVLLGLVACFGVSLELGKKYYNTHADLGGTSVHAKNAYEFQTVVPTKHGVMYIETKVIGAYGSPQAALAAMMSRASVDPMPVADWDIEMISPATFAERAQFMFLPAPGCSKDGEPVTCEALSSALIASSTKVATPAP